MNINELKKEAYETKREDKEIAYTRLADKAHKESQSRYDTSRELASCIPMGQPMMPDHHSYKSDCSFRNKIRTNFVKGMELEDKAKHYENKLEAIQSNKAISSDDPEALNKLKAKLEGLETQRTNIKEHNKKARKEKKDVYPGYVLSNLGGNIKNVKDRITRLERQALAIKEVEETGEFKGCKFDGGEVVENLVFNRLQILFDEKPNEEMRTKLKLRGFRWSPKAGAWQRLLNGNARYAARSVLGIGGK